MRLLSDYFTNPFESPRISVAALLAFTTDHLQRMVANNPAGLLDERITVTTSCLEAWQNALSADSTRLGVRKARKLGKRNFRKTLPAQVTKILAGVWSFFGVESPQALECCPQGRTVFGACRDDQLAVHLRTLIAGVTNVQAFVGAGLVAQASALLDQWLLVYEASEGSTSARAAAHAEAHQARTALQLQLYQTLLKLASAFPLQPEKLGLYMQQHLLVKGEG